MYFFFMVSFFCFENRHACLGGDVDDFLDAVAALLAHPEVLDVGGGDLAVLYADGFGGTFCTLYLGLCVQLLGFEVCLGLLDLDAAVLLGLCEFGLASHFLPPYSVAGAKGHGCRDECDGCNDACDDDSFCCFFFHSVLNFVVNKNMFIFAF